MVAVAPDEEPPQADDIKIEYHPHSGHAMEYFRFEDYGHTKKSTLATSQNQELWKPFHSHVDFEFSEFMLRASLNKDLSDTLIQLVHQVKQNPEAFTIINHDDVSHTWNEAVHLATPVCISNK